MQCLGLPLEDVTAASFGDLFQCCNAEHGDDVHVHPWYVVSEQVQRFLEVRLVVLCTVEFLFRDDALDYLS